VRGFAAFYVMIGHIANVLFANGTTSLQRALLIPFRFAVEAVVLFFLLSGFVIAYNTPRTTSIGTYLFKRGRRIYPLFVLSLVVSYFLGCLAERHWLDFEVGRFVGNLMMFQDFGYRRPGVWVDQFHNSVLWSLAFEWWFYIAFIPFFRELIPTRIQLPVVLAVSWICLGINLLFPNPIAWWGIYFQIWWAGVWMAREFQESGRVTIRRQLPFLVSMSAMAVAWFALRQSIPPEERGFGLYPIIDARRFGSAVVWIVLSVSWARIGWRFYRQTLGPFEWIAPVSYGLYIFHFPIIALLGTLPHLTSRPWLLITVAMATSFAVAAFAELTIQQSVNRWLDHLRGKPPRIAAEASA
jgi:peptidoglycan/LPS O-acetylase OafA/YrhL